MQIRERIKLRVGSFPFVIPDFTLKESLIEEPILLPLDTVR